MRWSDLAPGLEQFHTYQRAWLRGDVVAGLTVAAYLVPQVMAYATVAGLPPVVGLWAALVPLAVYAVLGSSRQLSVGPESTTALMTAAALAPLAAGDPGRYAALAAAVALLVGAICFLGGLVRLGFLADLLSRPVLVGYMTGVAVIMIGSQLGKVTGVPVDGDEFVDQVRSFAAGLHALHWPTIVLSVSVLVVLLVLARVAPRIPGPLIAILAATAVVTIFSLQRNGIDVIGEIPSGLPTPGIPDVAIADVAALMMPAVGIAIVAFSDNVLTARTFAARQGQRVDANAELRALGICNAGTALTHGFPVSSSGSRTALGDALGSRSQLYSMVTLLFVVVVMLAGREVLASFPMAALGALVVYAAPLFFANAEDFLERALAAVDDNPGPVEWFVLNAEANVEVDLTALDVLDQLRAELASRGTVFAMARVKQDLRDALRAAGLIDKIGEDHIFMTLPTAVEAYRNRRMP
jgi:sulfate permease, SulP family